MPRGSAQSPVEAGVLCANIQWSGSDHSQARALSGAPVQRIGEQVSVCAPGRVGKRVCVRARLCVHARACGRKKRTERKRKHSVQ